MKTIKIFTLLALSLLFFQCEKSNALPQQLCLERATKFIQINTQNEIIIEVPTCFEQMSSQGIDSYVGKIEATDIGLEIQYDIGGFTGNYVSENSPNQTTVQGEFEVFRYEIQEDQLYFTFPNAGPANFFTKQLDLKDELIEIFKTLQVN